jgi:membrane-associated phospholipid phosphatase
MIRVLRILFFLACLFAPLLVHAQALPIDKLTPPLPTAGERKAADLASWGTVLAAVALDAKASWDAPDRKRAFLLQGARIGIAQGLTFGLKKLVQRERPCAPHDCGMDNPDFSFPSGHAMLAGTSYGGPRLAFSVPLIVGTGGLRIAANKHWFTDTAAGALIGMAVGKWVR